MKKIFSILIVSVMVLSLFACAKKQSVAVLPEEGGVDDVKNFVVGFDAEYPPFGYLDTATNEYTGFDLDLAYEFCKRNGYTLVKQPIDWDSKDMEINSGNIDCIWNGFTMNGRENDYTWTFPYIDNSIVLVVNSDSGIKEKKDLKGKNVMVQAASSGLAALQDEANKDLLDSFAKLEECADYNNAFMNLEAGVTDCVAVDIGVAKYNLKNKAGKFVILDEQVSSEQYAVGFKKGNKELAMLVEKTLSDMWKDGTVEKIADKYADYSLKDTLCLGDYVE